MSLGKVPGSGERLREGLHKLEIKRPGYDALSREVRIRAGKDQSMFITWPDDRGATSLTVLSTPAGQRLSIDGVVRGTTPLYLTDMEPGSYELELSRAGEGGVYAVTGENRIDLGGGENAGRVFFINHTESFGADLLEQDFFRLSLENVPGGGKPVIAYQGGGGLAVTAESLPDSALLGLESRPFVIDELDYTLEMKQFLGLETL